MVATLKDEGVVSTASASRAVKTPNGRFRLFILWALAEKKTAELIQTALMDESVTASFYEPKALFRNQAYLSSLANALYELQEKYDVALLPESEGLDRSWPVNKK